MGRVLLRRTGEGEPGIQPAPESAGPPGVRVPRAGQPLPWAVVAAAAVVAFCWIAWLLLRRADGLATPAYDQAIFQQLAWNLGRGRGFHTEFFPVDFLGVHFSPLLALPALLELGWADARLLSLLHAASLAAAAPAAFLFIRALLPQGRGWPAAALAAPVPFWAELQQAGLSDFHPEVMALPLALLAGWAGLRGCFPLMWLLALGALAAKEDQVYTVAVIGLVVARHGTPRQGAALVGAAVAWGLAVFLVVMPALRAGVPVQTGAYYAWLDRATAGQVLSAFGHPVGWLALGGMVLSMAALPLLRPGWLLLALPPLLADLLSRHDRQPDLQLHYGLLLAVPVLVAGALGARRLAGRLEAGRLGLAALAAPALVLAFAFGGLPPAPGADWRPFQLPPGLGSLRKVTSGLPEGDGLAVDDGLAAGLSDRRRLTLLTQAGAGDYLVVDRRAWLPGYVDKGARSRRLAALSGSGRRLVADDGRFQVWSPVGR